MSFDAVIGQDSAKEILRQLLAQDRLGHACLFTGPDGVGKTLLAQETAKALLCRGDGERPCGACRDCLLFAHDGHPDFMLLEPEGTSRVIKIDQVRELIRTFSLAPVQGDRRVAVIRDADALKEEAANALLKTLEEPPSYATLLLTTSRLRSLLPTLRSRCMEIRFAPLSPEQVQAVMDLPHVRESLAEFQPEDVQAAVRLANGSADKAIQLLESGCMEIRKTTLDRVLALPSEDAFAIADDVMAWAKAADKALEPQRERVRGFLYLLESAYRDITLLRVGGDRAALLHPASATASLLRRAETEKLTPGRLSRLEEEVWEARRQTDANASMDLVLQNLLLRLAALQ